MGSVRGPQGAKLAWQGKGLTWAAWRGTCRQGRWGLWRTRRQVGVQGPRVGKCPGLWTRAVGQVIGVRLWSVGAELERHLGDWDPQTCGKPKVLGQRLWVTLAREKSPRWGPRWAPRSSVFRAGRAGRPARETDRSPGRRRPSPASITVSGTVTSVSLTLGHGWPLTYTWPHGLCCPRLPRTDALSCFLSLCFGNRGAEGLSPQHVREEARSAPAGRPRPCRVVSEPHGVENPPNLFGKLRNGLE